MSNASQSMLSVDEALARIIRAMPKLTSEAVPFEEAAERILAEAVIARRTHPPFAVSAMDGYAVRSADALETPFTLKEIGEVPAGSAFSGTVTKGATVRIFTGGRMPEGADAVIIQENAQASRDAITFASSAAPGDNTRPAGNDFSEGDEGFAAGHRVAPQDLALLAAMDVTAVSVARRPRVALLATGDELARPGEPRGPNQIVASNTYGLAALLKTWGAEPIDLGIAKDTPESLRAALRGAETADMLITLGGASVGDHDLVQKVLTEEGLALDFWKIAMKPGKPLIFGRWAESPFFGLPGNPVSSLVTAILFVKPALFAMQGHAAPEKANPMVPVTLGRDLPANTERQEFMRAAVTYEDGRLIATPFSSQDSAKLSVFSSAGCLVIREPHAPAAKAGESASAIPLFV